jgi:ankyrin repeat protein
MDCLCEQGVLGGIKTALSQLPENESRAFEASIKQIKERETLQNKEFEHSLAKHALTWIIHAKTLLNEDQIKESFAIQYSTECLNKDFVPAEVDWTSLCAGLVVMDSEKRTLLLVHKSVEKYLLEHDIIPRRVDLDMAKKCLKYLLFDVQDQSSDRPLLAYAASHWVTHLRHSGLQGDTEVETLALAFLRQGFKVRDAFRTMPGMSSSAFNHMTGLHATIYFNLEKLATRLIDEGVGVNAVCLNGQTALHWAVQYSRSALVELLIRRSADPDLQDKNGNTPLHVAVIWPVVKSENIVRKLLSGNARPNIRGSKGVTPLMWAIRYGQPTIAKLLIESQTNVDEEVEKGWTSLRQAVSHNRKYLVDLLLDRGVDLDRPSTDDGWTPLIFAAQNGNEWLADRLLQRHHKPANVNLRDPFKGYTPLGWAIFYKHVKVVRLFIEHGANVNEEFKDGSTPLIKAIESREQNVVWMLLNSGAQLDYQDHERKTALHHAITIGDRSIIWLLVSSKASLSLRDKRECNVLDWTIEHDALSVAWLLCENGASLENANDQGMTALHRAVGQGKLEFVKLFLDRRGDIDQKDSRGLTPLHYAVIENRESILELLVLKGAKLDAQDNGGAAALHYAAYHNYTNIISLLARTGASLKVQERNGLTPRMAAQQMGERCEAAARLLSEFEVDSHVPTRVDGGLDSISTLGSMLPLHTQKSR